jgi:hypothetical protein
VGEADTLGLELDDSRPGGLLEPVENLRSLAVRVDQRLDCRSRESGDEEQNLATGRRKPGKACAYDLPEAAGDR